MIDKLKKILKDYPGNKLDKFIFEEESKKFLEWLPSQKGYKEAIIRFVPENYYDKSTISNLMDSGKNEIKFFKIFDCYGDISLEIKVGSDVFYTLPFNISCLENYFTFFRENIGLKDIEEAIEIIKKEGLILQENVFVLFPDVDKEGDEVMYIKHEDDEWNLCFLNTPMISIKDCPNNHELLKEIKRSSDIVDEKREFIEKYFPIWVQLNENNWKEFIKRKQTIPDKINILNIGHISYINGKIKVFTSYSPKESITFNIDELLQI